MKTEAKKPFEKTSIFYQRGGSGATQSVTIVHNAGPFNRDGKVVNRGGKVVEDGPSGKSKAIMPSCHM